MFACHHRGIKLGEKVMMDDTCLCLFEDVKLKGDEQSNLI